MFFLIRMAFWFSLVLLLLPLDPAGTNGANVSPVHAFFAAQQAVDDVSGICERKPDVCEVGKAAMQTIGVRARETARIAYEMFEENGKPVRADEVGALITSDDVAVPTVEPTDSAATGSVKVSN
jgi:hypothetical protein